MNRLRYTGARPSPRSRLASARPHRITGVTQSQYIVVPPVLSYWLNNTQADCVTAEEAFAKAAASVMLGQSEVLISDAEVGAWATANAFLNGAVLIDVLDKMQTAGFSQDGVLYNDGSVSSVAWTDLPTLQNAISMGPVKLGVVGDPLDAVVGETNGWLLTGVPPQAEPNQNPNENHCISACGYGSIGWLLQQLGAGVPAGVDGSQPGIAVFTWRTIGVIDWPSLPNMTFEAWLRSPTTVATAPVTPPPPPPLPPGSTIVLQPGTYTLQISPPTMVGKPQSIGAKP